MSYVDLAAPTRTWTARGAIHRGTTTPASWIIDLEPASWAPASDKVILDRWNTGQDSYAIVLATDGIDFTFVNSDGTQRTYTFTLPGGTAGRQVLTILYEPDFETVRAWIRPGQHLTPGGTPMGVQSQRSTSNRARSLAVSTSPVYLGTADADAPDLWSRFQGKVYGVEHRNGNTVVFRWNRGVLDPTASSFNDEQAFSWAVAGTGDVDEFVGILTLNPVSATPGVPVGRTPPTLVSVSLSNWSDIATGSDTTASVSWQTGDVIVVLGATEDTTITLSTPTATGLTFTLVASFTTASGTPVWAWSATAGSNGSSAISAAHSPNQSNMCGIVAYVWRGSEGVGASGASRPGATWTRSLTRGQDRSAVVAMGADWAAVNDTSVTATPTGTIDGPSGTNVAVNTTQATFWAGHWSDEGTAGTTSYGITNYTATSNFTEVTVEVLGAAGGAPSVADIAGSLTLNAVAATATPGLVTVADTPATVDLVPVAATPTPGPVTVAAIAGNLDLIPVAATPWPGSIVTLTPATLTLNAVAATPTPGPVTVADTPGTLTLEPVQDTLSGVVTVSPGTLTLEPVAATPTPGPVTTSDTPATLDLNPVAATVTPGVVTVADVPATLDLNPVAATATPGVVTVVDTPATLTLNAVAATTTPGPVTTADTPATLDLVPVAATATPGVVTVADTPATLILEPVAAFVPTYVADIPGSFTLEPVGATLFGNVIVQQGTLVLNPVALTPVPGPVTFAISAADLTLAPVADTPVPGPSIVAETPGTLTLTPVAATATPGLVTVALVPGTLTLVPVAAAVDSPVIVVPGALTLVGVPDLVTPGPVTVSMTPGTLTLEPVTDIVLGVVVVELLWVGLLQRRWGSGRFSRKWSSGQFQPSSEHQSLHPLRR